MGERIPVEIIDATIARNTPAQLGGLIHTRSFEGHYRRLRLLGAGLLFLLLFGTAWLNWHQRQADSNTNNVEVAVAHRRPSPSCSVASANATRRPMDTTRPTARTRPLFSFMARR